MTTISRSDIVAGDTSDVWEIGLKTSSSIRSALQYAALDLNFTCRIAVGQSTPAILRAVSEKNTDGTRFRAWLTPAETLALGAGLWLVGIELRNDTLSPPLVAELQWSLNIAPGVVPPPT